MLKEEVTSKVITARLGVLILILMEHAQRVEFEWSDNVWMQSLNPYFNGTCSKSALASVSARLEKS